jgi:hypothetical protein
VYIFTLSELNEQHCFCFEAAVLCVVTIIPSISGENKKCRDEEGEFSVCVDGQYYSDCIVSGFYLVVYVFTSLIINGH